MGVEDGEQHGDEVQRLRPVYAPANNASDRLLLTLGKKPGPEAVFDAEQKRESEDQDVEPVFDQRDARPVKTRQQTGLERHEGHGEEEG